MSKEDQTQMIGEKTIERSESRRRLQCLIERSARYAEECQQIAWELNKAAAKPTGDRKPGLTLYARTFITKAEFDTLIREMENERNRLTDIESFFSDMGL